MPGTFFTSPGFLLAIGVAEFLYAIVLFAVMTSAPKGQGGSEIGKVTPAPTGPPRVEPKGSDLAERASAAPAKDKPLEVASVSPQAPSTAPKTSPSPPPPAANVVTPKPGEAPSPANPKSNVAGNEPGSKNGPTLKPLGPLIDPLKDCQVKGDTSGITIVVPPSLHIFDPNSKVRSSPRALAEVSGDFVVQVKVPGAIRPGTQPIKDLPFTFQGAGLLLWQDDDNYVRFERSAQFSTARGSLHQVLVEYCKDGKMGRNVFLTIREGAITLRLERHGGELICTYSSDGKTWLPVKKWAASLSPRVSVGISASNAAPRPFSARFEEFALTRSSGKPG